MKDEGKVVIEAITRLYKIELGGLLRRRNADNPNRALGVDDFTIREQLDSVIKEVEGVLEGLEAIEDSAGSVKETTLKEKLEIIGAVGPVLAELNRFGETLFEINTEARLAARMMMDKGVEGAEAQLLHLEGEIRKQTQDLSSRCYFISIVVWEILDSICEERGFVHYKDREGEHDASDGVSVPEEE